MKVSQTKQLQIPTVVEDGFEEFLLTKDLQVNEKNDCTKLFQYLRNGFGKGAYERFLKHVKCAGVRVERNAIVLVVSSEFIKGVILQSYFREIATFVYNNCNSAKKIEIVVKKIDVQVVKQQTFSCEKSVQVIKYKHDDRLSFESFVSGESNRLAYCSARQVSEMILSDESPNTSSLCLFGPVGMGKTHLMKSIVGYVKSAKNDCKIEYISAEEFKNSYIDSVRKNDLFKFKKRFSDLDALLLDDVQFICSSTGSLEKEFARILNSFIDDKRWVVIASDRPPSSLTMDARTKSRISSGLKASIQPSDFTLRMLILQSKLRQLYESYDISMHLLEHIAKHVMTSIRELESILHNIISYANVMKVKTIQESVVHEIIGRCDFVQTQNSKVGEMDFDGILKAFCEYYGIKKSDVLGNGRTKKISRARSAIAYTARNSTCMTLKEIGEQLCRNHATVLYLINAVQNDKSLLNEIQQFIPT